MSERVVLNEQGFPVMLANVPGSGVGKIDPNAASGNNAHDTRSGKFAAKGGDKKKRTTPANVNPADFSRMFDAVREAARKFAGNLTEENLMSFIAKRASNPSAVNAQQFLQLVQQQQLNDLVDVLDSQTPRSGPKLQAPRSYVKRMLAGMSDDDVAEIITRLEARGNDPGNLDKIIIGKRIPKDRQEAVRAKKAKLAASDSGWVADEDELLFQGGHIDTDEIPIVLDNDYVLTPHQAIQMAETIAKNIQPPVVNVSPVINVEAPRPSRREIIRDEKTGLAIGVREVPEEE